jgi:hypothetical protein
MKLDLARIRANCTSLSDEAFQHELLLGPGGFTSPDVWFIYLAEAERRGIDQSLIPRSADDPLVALAAFQANIQITEGHFEPPAQFRPDKKLILIRRDESEPSLRNRLVQLDVTRDICGVEIVRRGIGSWATGLATVALGGGLIVGALVAGALHKTGKSVTIFTLVLENDEIIVAKADPELVSALERAARH